MDLFMYSQKSHLLGEISTYLHSVHEYAFSQVLHNLSHDKQLPKFQNLEVWHPLISKFGYK